MTSRSKYRNVFIGFPDDLPQVGIDAVNELARRDLAGERVPTLVISYVGNDGRRKRLIWQSDAAHRAYLAELGVTA